VCDYLPPSPISFIVRTVNRFNHRFALRSSMWDDFYIDGKFVGSGDDLSYCDLSDASLREADLRGTVLYPCETIGAKFYGAKFSANDGAAEYARTALEDMCRRSRIREVSVAYRKLQRINGWASPSLDIPPMKRGQHRSFVWESP
jgi:Pentapeptide repeats (8 copies)